MSKVHFCQIIFLLVEIVAMIPLTIEVFGDMNPDRLTASALIIGIGLLGNSACAIVRAIGQTKKTKQDRD